MVQLTQLTFSAPPRYTSSRLLPNPGGGGSCLSLQQIPGQITGSPPTPFSSIFNCPLGFSFRCHSQPRARDLRPSSSFVEAEPSSVPFVAQLR